MREYRAIRLKLHTRDTVPRIAGNWHRYPSKPIGILRNWFLPKLSLTLCESLPALSHWVVLQGHTNILDPHSCYPFIFRVLFQGVGVLIGRLPRPTGASQNYAFRSSDTHSVKKHNSARTRRLPCVRTAHNLTYGTYIISYSILHFPPPTQEQNRYSLRCDGTEPMILPATTRRCHPMHQAIDYYIIEVT